MSRELDELLALTATLVPGLEGRVEGEYESTADRRAAAPDGGPPASGIRPARTTPPPSATCATGGWSAIPRPARTIWRCAAGAC